MSSRIQYLCNPPPPQTTPPSPQKFIHKTSAKSPALSSRIVVDVFSFTQTMCATTSLLPSSTSVITAGVFTQEKTAYAFAGSYRSSTNCLCFFCNARTICFRSIAVAVVHRENSGLYRSKNRKKTILVRGWFRS